MNDFDKNQERFDRLSDYIHGLLYCDDCGWVNYTDDGWWGNTMVQIGGCKCGGDIRFEYLHRMIVIESEEGS